MPPPGDTGVIFIAAKRSTRPVLERAAADLGLTFTGMGVVAGRRGIEAAGPAASALLDRYGGSSPSGWTRWILERYEFPHEVVYAQALDAGNLSRRFDAIILTDDALTRASDARALERPRCPRSIGTRPEASPGIATIPQLTRFVEDGGTLLAIGDATAIAERIGLPVTSALTAVDGSGQTRPLTAPEFYIPGSLLRVSVDNTTPLGFGFEREVDVFFDTSPAFRLRRDAAAAQRAPRGLVRSRRRRCAAAGHGGRSISTAASRWWMRARARAACCCSGRRSAIARSRTARSSSSSTAFTMRGRCRPDCRVLLCDPVDTFPTSVSYSMTGGWRTRQLLSIDKES